MDLTKEELDKIKANLTAEDKIELSKNFALAAGTIRNILSGRAKNPAVVEAAAEIAVKNKSTNDERQLRLKATLNAL